MNIEHATPDVPLYVLAVCCYDAIIPFSAHSIRFLVLNGRTAPVVKI